MDHDIKDYVVHEELIEDHRNDKLRSGEGSICELPDGSLYFVYGKFAGAADEDKATLIELRSYDGGCSWSDKKELLKPDDDILNNMSISLLKLHDGRIAMVYLHKVSTTLCYPLFMTSSDNAKTWSDPIDVASEKKGYYVVNNDRLIQLKNGRILLPYAWHGDTPVFGAEGFLVYCGCFISDDAGKSWRLSKNKIVIEKDNIVMPRKVHEENPAAYKHIQDGWVQCQEPGVVELDNGKVMMWCRTPGGYAYRAYSNDGGNNWGPFTAIEEFLMPCGPQSIKKIPGTDRYIMLYNDRGELPFGHPQFHWRRPLSVAVSDNDRGVWKFHGLLENEDVPSNCYYSICFTGGNVVFSYYEGVMNTDKNGLFRPKNLSSLKLKVVKQKYFML